MTAIFAPIRMIEDQLAALVARNGFFADDPHDRPPEIKSGHGVPRDSGGTVLGMSAPSNDAWLPQRNPGCGAYLVCDADPAVVFPIVCDPCCPSGRYRL